MGRMLLDDLSFEHAPISGDALRTANLLSASRRFICYLTTYIRRITGHCAISRTQHTRPISTIRQISSISLQLASPMRPHRIKYRRHNLLERRKSVQLAPVAAGVAADDDEVHVVFRRVGVLAYAAQRGRDLSVAAA